MQRLSRLLAPAALHALALFLFACTPQLPSVQHPRMGGIATTIPGNAAGKFVEATIVSAAPATTSFTSDVVDLRGYQDGAFLEITFAGMAAGTNLVGTIELLGGNESAAASMGTLLLDAAWVMTGTGTTLPVGLSIDAEVDGFAIADDFATNSRLRIPMGNLPSYFVLKFTRTSGGTDATITATIKAHN